MTDTIVVVGLGEVGKPLLELVERAGHHGVGLDVERGTVPEKGGTQVMHVCFPFEVDDFVGETVKYIELIEPELTVVNSTVAVGTTREIFQRCSRPIAHSPVRGKHARMAAEMLSYTKHVGGSDREAGETAAAHFRSLGMTTRVASSPEATELAKLTETTYFGLLIAWAQEVERYCDLTEQSYDEVTSFYEEIGFFPPVRYFPGVIGGHCITPNIEILSRLAETDILDAIRSSNEEKLKRARREEAA